MRRAAVLLLGLSVLTVRADDKGTDVSFDGLKSATPAGWKEETPSNRLRWMQFRVPKAKDDEANGELYITKGITGSKDDNLKRWKGQFLPPEGKKIDDVTKVEEFKVAGCEVLYVDMLRGSTSVRPMTLSSAMGKRLVSPCPTICAPPTPEKRMPGAPARSAAISGAPSASPDGSPATSIRCKVIAGR